MKILSKISDDMRYMGILMAILLIDMFLAYLGW